MKESKYNYLISYENDYVLFNGLTRKMIIIPSHYHDTFKELLNDLSVLNSSDILREKLIDGGFIVEDEVNEIEILMRLHKQNIETPVYTLTILPTFHCNFACWYCFQSHREEYMSKNTVDNIKLHISKYLIENKIREFILVWFGGEPLLCFNDLVVEICTYALEFCNKNGINFSNAITTNGYLITREIAKQMNILNFQCFQITIDGMRDKHNSVRNENGLPSFDRILENIAIILETNPEAIVYLRFNYTDQNLQEEEIINEVNKFIPEIYRKRVIAFPRKVWQIDKNNISVGTVDDMEEHFFKDGYKLCDVNIAKDYMNCYACKSHHNVIYHDGNVDKCTNVDPEETTHYLNNSGEIIAKANIIGHEQYEPFVKGSKCYSCKHLPICLGPCIKGLRAMAKNNKFVCIQHTGETTIHEDIRHYCKQILQEELLVK